MNRRTLLPLSEFNYFAPKKHARIVSFWDMLQIDARTFLAGLTHISGALAEYKLILQLAGTGAFSASSPIEHRAHVLNAVKNLQSNCQEHGLTTSTKMAEQAYETCMATLAGDAWQNSVNLQRTISALEGLINTTVLEAESRKFYVLAGGIEETHDDADTLFGAEVVDAFPHAAFDIAEAGKCISFGLWTACVMHTMRVLETGLQRLAQHVGVVPADNWNKTLNEIEAALRLVRKNTQGPEAEQWAAEAGTHLRFVKNAWRNHAMHHATNYDEQKAKAIFNNARSYMQHLTQGIAQSNTVK